jgi:hypothetical protein
MKRNHEYETETLETYYVIGKGNEFFQQFGYDVVYNVRLELGKRPEGSIFNTYEEAKEFITKYFEPCNLKGFKIYSIHHKVKTNTCYTVLDCDKYVTEQNGPMVLGKNVMFLVESLIRT